VLAATGILLSELGTFSNLLQNTTHRGGAAMPKKDDASAEAMIAFLKKIATSPPTHPAKSTIFRPQQNDKELAIIALAHLGVKELD
jgi:hypothetical protein